MTTAPEGSALETALAWLEAVVLNSGNDDPRDDAAIWILTHESWRCAIVGACLGPDDAELGKTQDVETLPDWTMLARCAVCRIREALPATVQAMGIGGYIGITGLEIPESLDRVQVIFNDESLEPGRYEAPAGTRVGFALTMVREEMGWTVERVERDWLRPEWLDGFDRLAP